jgi:hypothetical protein
MPPEDYDNRTGHIQKKTSHLTSRLQEVSSKRIPGLSFWMRVILIDKSVASGLFRSSLEEVLSPVIPDEQNPYSSHPRPSLLFKLERET